MAKPTYLQVIDDFNAAVDARFADQVRLLAAWYRKAGQAMLNEMEALARELAERKAANRPYHAEALFQMSRYHELLAQLNNRLAGLNTATIPLLEKEQALWAAYGDGFARDMVGALTRQLPLSGPNTVDLGFNYLRDEAIRNIVALARNGQPLNSLLSRISPETAMVMTEVLVAGTAMGRGPRDTARLMMQKGFGAGLNRALLIARDQQIRAYREATRQGYKQLGVTHYKRLAAHNFRTCVAGESLIRVKGGLKTIAEVEAGEFVMTRQGLQRVLATGRRLYEGEMLSVEHEHGLLVCTPDHLVWDANVCDWVAAGRLRPFSRLRTYYGFSQVTYVRRWHDQLPVFNLTVENATEFYANGLLVHNCAACLALDGSIWEIDQLMPLHPQDRCTMVAVIEGLTPEWESGEAWFEKQDEATQRHILGPGRLDAWKAGRFNFEQLVSVTDHPVWGPTANVTSLKNLRDGRGGLRPERGGPPGRPTPTGAAPKDAGPIIDEIALPADKIIKTGDIFQSVKFDPDVIGRLMAASGVDDRQKVWQMLSEYAKSPTETYFALQMQVAAAKVLNAPLPDWVQQRLAEFEAQSADLLAKGFKKRAAIEVDEWNTTPAEREAVIKAMYDETQARLKKLGYGPDDKIVLYRGVGRDGTPFEPGDISLSDNPISSMTSDYKVALLYAKNRANPLDDPFEYGAVLKFEVPVRDILSGYRTGFGLPDLSELAVVGSRLARAEIVEVVTNRQPAAAPVLPGMPAHSSEVDLTIGERRIVGEMTPIGRGQHGAQLAEFADGTQGVFKPVRNLHESRAEVVAYILSERLGLGIVPPTAYNVALKGTVQTFIRGKLAVELDDPFPLYFKSPAGLKVGVLDYLLNNWDRNSGNWLVVGDRIIAIDHGFTLDMDSSNDNGFIRANRGVKLPNEVIQQLKSLSYDEVRDWFDFPLPGLPPLEMFRPDQKDHHARKVFERIQRLINAGALTPGEGEIYGPDI